MSVLDDPVFRDDDAARARLEGILWPDGPICPHCGHYDKIYKVKSKAARPGVYKCGQCRKQFTVTVGTLFERSKVPLHKWMQAVYLMCASKKGVSSHQLHRILGVTYQTAWFMTHRLREGMKDPVFARTPIGGDGSVVEIDETFWGWDQTKKPKGDKRGRGYAHKQKIFTLVERGGKAKSFHVEAVNASTLRPIMVKQIDRASTIMTDEASQYTKVGREYKRHGVVHHGRGEYVRGPIHTNTIENYFSILKRGLTGTYQHVSAKHLKRYIGEFDFRYNNRHVSDFERADAALRGIAGKRLTYRHSSAAA